MKQKPKPLADFTLADRIEMARVNANLTRKDLADVLGVDYMTICRWEWGDSAPSVQTLLAIAAACECEPGSLLPAADGGTHAPG